MEFDEAPLFPSSHKSAITNYTTYFYHATQQYFLSCRKYYELQRIIRDQAMTIFFNPAIVSLQPEFIKLDKSLVRHIHLYPNQQHIVKLLQEFAAQSGTYIIAEGIEELDEVAFLRQQGIQYGQGYVIKKPTTALVDAFLPLR